MEQSDVSQGDDEWRELRLVVGIPPANWVARAFGVARPDHYGVRVRYSVADQTDPHIAVREVPKAGNFVFDIVGVDDLHFEIARVEDNGAFVSSGDTRVQVSPGNYRVVVTVETNNGGLGPYVAEFLVATSRERSGWTRLLTQKQAGRTSVGQP